MIRTLATVLFTAAAGTLMAVAQAQTSPHQARLEIIHDKPFVMVKVNGKGPFRFVIDTGTGGEAFVSAGLAQQLGLVQSGKTNLNDPSGKSTVQVPTVILDSVEVANVEFSGVRAAVHNLGDGEGSCQGLLGFVFFRNYLLTLDYPDRRMILASGQLNPDGERSVLPFRSPDGIPIISLAVANMHIDAQLDSGGQGLSLPSSITAKLKFSSDFVALSNAHSLSTRFQVRGAILDGDARLASYTFKHPYVEINPAFPLANFGSCPMHGFVLTFDQKNGLVKLAARRHTLSLSASPIPMRLQGTPDRETADPRLVPLS